MGWFDSIGDIISSLIGSGGGEAAAAAAPAVTESASSGLLDALGGIATGVGGWVASNPGQALGALGSLGNLGLGIYGAANRPEPFQLPPAQLPLMGAPLAGTIPRRGVPPPDAQAAGLSGASPDFFRLMQQAAQGYNPYQYTFQPGGQAPGSFGA